MSYSILHHLHQKGISTGFQSMSQFVSSVIEKPNSHGSLNLLSHPIKSNFFEKLQNISSLLRFQRNPILLQFSGDNLQEFEKLSLVIDAGFYIVNVTQPDILLSLHKIDPDGNKLFSQPIKWRTESYKLA